MTEKRRATELQIQIDDVYACLGQCAGCVLAVEERRSQLPDMNEATLKLSIDRLVEHAAAMRPLQRINVTFGIADHILFGADYLVRLHELASAIIKAGNPTDKAHSAIFFTTSLVGKPSKVIALMEEVRARIGNEIQMVPLVVLDGRLIEAAKFGPMWRDMVLAAKALFGKVDLSTNLSADAISVMSPRQLADFAVTNGFDEVTVNWAPTLNNATRTLIDTKSMERWLLDFDAIAEGKEQITTSFRPVIAKTVDALMCKYDGTPPDLISTVTNLVPETILKSIEIDHMGNLLPKFEAIGDITHAARHGLEPLGHIATASIAELIEIAMPKVARKIASIHARGACATCAYSPVCAGTGFHIATNVARMTGIGINDKHSCPHVAFGLIDRIASELMTTHKERGLVGAW
jgi:hypothetical protein